MSIFFLRFFGRELALVRVRHCVKLTLIRWIITSWSSTLFVATVYCLWIRYRHSETFRFRAFKEYEACQIVHSIKLNSVDHNNISAKFMKLILPSLITPLTHIFNQITTTSSFADCWKIAMVSPFGEKAFSLKTFAQLAFFLLYPKSLNAW